MSIRIFRVLTSRRRRGSAPALQSSIQGRPGDSAGAAARAPRGLRPRRRRPDLALRKILVRRRGGRSRRRVFRKYLVHIKGELGGKPIDPMEWEQDEILRPLFGWKRWDGTRRYRGLDRGPAQKRQDDALRRDRALSDVRRRRAGRRGLRAAADKEQAAICFDIASAMVQSSPALSSAARSIAKTIVVPATFSKYASSRPMRSQSTALTRMASSSTRSMRSRIAT
jgi:hypothetical protein